MMMTSHLPLLLEEEDEDEEQGVLLLLVAGPLLEVREEGPEELLLVEMMMMRMHLGREGTGLFEVGELRRRKMREVTVSAVQPISILSHLQVDTS